VKLGIMTGEILVKIFPFFTSSNINLPKM